MRKYFVLLLFAVFLMIFATYVYAETADLYNDGKWKNDGNGVFQPVSLGSAGIKLPYELIAASDDTLTANDAGKTLVATADAYYHLPSAALGLFYTFVGSGSGVNVTVDPSAGDTINFRNMGASNILVSQAESSGGVPVGQITPDSLTLICPKANTWVIVNMQGSWLVK